MVEKITSMERSVIGCDMVVAVGRAAASCRTLFGQNCDMAEGQALEFARRPGRPHAPDEKLDLGRWQLLAPRRTYTVLACRMRGEWGYSQGVNEQGLAAGCAKLCTRQLSGRRGDYRGSDLVRLVLERCRSARQALEVLAELIEGRGNAPGPAGLAEDCAFFLCDPANAIAVETCGKHWVCQDILEVRALGNVCTIRQDWDRISHGLAPFAIREGLWPGDGSKLDFAGTLAKDPTGEQSGLRRWGRATLLLEQQNGHLDVAFLRRLQGDHYEGTSFEREALRPGGPVPICHHRAHTLGPATAGSMIVEFPNGQKPVAWFACGPPCSSLHFPLLLAGDLPQASHLGGLQSRGFWDYLRQWDNALREDPARTGEWCESVARLQARLDQDLADFIETAEAGAGPNRELEIQGQATRFMQDNLERFESAVATLSGHAVGFCADEVPSSLR